MSGRGTCCRTFSKSPSTRETGATRKFCGRRASVFSMTPCRSFWSRTSSVSLVEGDFENVLQHVPRPLYRLVGAKVLDEVWQGHHGVVEDVGPHVDAGHHLLVDERLLQLVRRLRRPLDRKVLDLSEAAGEGLGDGGRLRLRGHLS